MAQGNNAVIMSYKAKILGITDEKRTILPKNVIIVGIRRSVVNANNRVGGNSR